MIGHAKVIFGKLIYCFPARALTRALSGALTAAIYFVVQMNSEVTSRLKEVTQDFKCQLPIITELSNPAMRPQHWQKLFKVKYYLRTCATRRFSLSAVFEGTQTKYCLICT